MSNNSKEIFSKYDGREQDLCMIGMIDKRIENVNNLKRGHIEIIKKFIDSLKM